MLSVVHHTIDVFGESNIFFSIPTMNKPTAKAHSWKWKATNPKIGSSCWVIDCLSRINPTFLPKHLRSMTQQHKLTVAIVSLGIQQNKYYMENNKSIDTFMLLCY